MQDMRWLGGLRRPVREEGAFVGTTRMSELWYFRRQRSLLFGVIDLRSNVGGGGGGGEGRGSRLLKGKKGGEREARKCRDRIEKKKFNFYFYPVPLPFPQPFHFSHRREHNGVDSVQSAAEGYRITSIFTFEPLCMLLKLRVFSSDC